LREEAGQETQAGQEMKIYTMEQGSVEWHLERMVRPTASEFDRVMKPGSRKMSSQADAYIKQLVDNRTCEYLPERAELYLTRPMKLGLAREADARRWYCMTTGYTVARVGFITDDTGRFGCSPDGIVMQDGKAVGGCEIKCPLAKTHEKWAQQRGCPHEYLTQVHGGLVCSGLPWWDMVSYPPPVQNEYEFVPPFVVRVVPDDFTTELKVCLEIFHMRLTEALKGAKS
jgi:hypothetical protein